MYGSLKITEGDRQTRIEHRTGWGEKPVQTKKEDHPDVSRTRTNASIKYAEVRGKIALMSCKQKERDS